MFKSMLKVVGRLGAKSLTPQLEMVYKLCINVVLHLFSRRLASGELRHIFHAQSISSDLIFWVSKKEIVSLLSGGSVTLDLAFSLADLVLVIWVQDNKLLVMTGRMSLQLHDVFLLAELLESESGIRVTVPLE